MRGNHQRAAGYPFRTCDFFRRHQSDHKKGGNDFEHSVSTRAAEHDDYEINVLSRGPIIEDKAFYMVQGRWSDFGGQYRNRIDGRKVGQERSHGVNASLEFKMADDVIVRVSGGHGVDEDGIAAIALQDRFSNNCFLSAPFSITAARSKFRTAFNWTPPDCRALKGCTVIQRACSARSNTTATVSR